MGAGFGFRNDPPYGQGLEAAVTSASAWGHSPSKLGAHPPAGQGENREL